MKGFIEVKNIALRKSQLIDHSRTKKNAGKKCKNILLLDGQEI